MIDLLALLKGIFTSSSKNFINIHFGKKETNTTHICPTYMMFKSPNKVKNGPKNRTQKFLQPTLFDK